MPANLGTQERPIEFDTWSGSNPVFLVADREWKTHKSTLIISKIFTPDPFNVIKRVNSGRGVREEGNLQLNRKGLFSCFICLFFKPSI